MPRILRRGMGYGPSAAEAPADAERGTFFMAYCASIAEQFETMQRWVAGGNSSGVGSAQSDPLLGVPRAGERRMFRWVDATAQPQRAELGTKAFVELQWGLYLFVPALAGAAGALADFRSAPIRGACRDAARRPAEIDQWRARLEDRDNGRAPGRRCASSTAANRTQRTTAGWSARPRVCSMHWPTPNARRCRCKASASAWRHRSGINHLGMDPADGHAAIGSVVNPVIAAIDEDAGLRALRACAARVLAKIEQLSSGAFALRHPDGRLRLPVDLMNFSEQVVGALAGCGSACPTGTGTWRPAAGCRRRRPRAGRVARATSSAPRA